MVCFQSTGILSRWHDRERRASEFAIHLLSKSKDTYKDRMCGTIHVYKISDAWSLSVSAAPGGRGKTKQHAKPSKTNKSRFRDGDLLHGDRGMGDEGWMT